MFIKRIKSFFIVTFLTLLLYSAIDLIFGAILLNMLNDPVAIERVYRNTNSYYHHDLAKNFSGEGSWGSRRYSICTNQFGFKDSCSSKVNGDKSFDLAFIGDSFTEGIGLPYEDTFVGQIATEYPDLKIANLGVGSYSPSIYLAKVKKLIDEGFSFEEVVVYVDISDIQDEAISYIYQDGKVYDLDPSNGHPIMTNNFINELKIIIKNKFPITYHSLYIFKGYIKSLRTNQALQENNNWDYFSKNYARSNWTYNTLSDGYGVAGVKASITKSVKLMEDLHQLLSQNNIKLSVGVYPWPGQLLYDSEESIQVKIWSDFCINKCNNFYNSFPLFFQELKTNGTSQAIEKIYISRDVHFNSYGMSLVAKNFIESQ